MTEAARKYIEEKLRSERDTGALIYIKLKDDKEKPLNLIDNGIENKRIKTGYWPNSLKKYSIK